MGGCVDGVVAAVGEVTAADAVVVVGGLEAVVWSVVCRLREKMHGCMDGYVEVAVEN